MLLNLYLILVNLDLNMYTWLVAGAGKPLGPDVINFGIAFLAWCEGCLRTHGNFCDLHLHCILTSPLTARATTPYQAFLTLAPPSVWL